MKTTKPKKNELCTWSGKLCSDKVAVDTISVCDELVLICKICLVEFEQRLKESRIKANHKSDNFD